jgi:hypothetical protein
MPGKKTAADIQNGSDIVRCTVWNKSTILCKRKIAGTTDIYGLELFRFTFFP